MLSYNELENLIEAVRSGDEAGIQEAQAVSARESKVANQQLRRLERSGLESSPAYQQAKFFMDEDLGGVSYFSQSKKLEGESLVRQLEIVYDFRHDKTSTVTGEKERRAGFDKQIKELEIERPMTKKERGYMRGFLGSDFWKDFKSTIYRTGSKKDRTPDESSDARKAIAEAADAIKRGASISQLEDLYEQFKTQQDPEIDIYEVMESWYEFKLNA